MDVKIESLGMPIKETGEMKKRKTCENRERHTGCDKIKRRLWE